MDRNLEMIIGYIIYTIIDSLIYTSMLVMMSVGLVLIFSILGVINFAHASFYALGAYISYSLIYLFTPTPSLIFPAIIASAVLVGIIGAIFERYLLSFIYGRADVFQLLLTFGAILLFDGIIRMEWGGWPLTVQEPLLVYGSLAGYPIYYFIIVVFAVVVIIALKLLLFKTRYGRIIRAVSSFKEMSMALGINVKNTYTSVFSLGCFFAGLGGGLMVPLTQAMPGIGLEALIVAFVVIVIGGMGSLKGAVIGSVIVGFTRTIGIALFPKIELAIVFLIMVVILLIRPTGIFGK